MTALEHANRAFLLQAAELLETLPPAAFREAHPVAPGGSAGAHLRHCIEHYDCFFAADEADCLDYAKRPRNEALETNPQLAISRCRELADRMLLPERTKGPLQLQSDHEGLTVTTSRERELQFLASHTVHHFALIAIVLRLHGIGVPQDFGVAPSTLRHRKALSCAQ